MHKTTRDKILDATIELLWQQSYGSVSVDHICHAARVQKGSFYHYFPSKVDVVIEAFEAFWQNNRSFYDAIFAPDLPPLTRLQTFCDTMYTKQKEKSDAFGKVLGCPYMACGSELGAQDERIRAKMDEIFNRVTLYFETLARDAKACESAEAKVTAQEMQCYIAGVLYQAKLKNDVEVIRRDLLPGLMLFLRQDAPLPRTETQYAYAS